MSNPLDIRNMEKDSRGKFIDKYSNTVEDALWFEVRYNAEHPEDDPYYGSDYEDHPEGFEPERDEDPCKCSDPCCPCTGIKQGHP